MTTDEAERIITAFYSDDPDGMLSDLKLYAEQGFKTVQSIASELLDSDWDYEEAWRRPLFLLINFNRALMIYSIQ